MRKKIKNICLIFLVLLWKCSPPANNTDVCNKVSIKKVTYSLTSLENKYARYNADLSIWASEDQIVDIDLLVDRKNVIKIRDLSLKEGLNTQLVSFTIHNPKLWWTNNLGKPYVYKVTLQISDSKELCYEIEQNLAVRQIGLISNVAVFKGQKQVTVNGFATIIKGIGLSFPPQNNLDSTVSLYKWGIREAYNANCNYVNIEDSLVGDNPEIITVCYKLGVLNSNMKELKDFKPTRFGFISNPTLFQAQQIKTFMEKDRVNNLSTGYLYSHLFTSGKSLNDALLNSDLSRKSAYYSLLKIYNSCTVIPVNSGTKVDVHVFNDQLKDLDAILLCKLTDFMGNDYFVKQVPVSVKANSSIVAVSVNKSVLFKRITATNSFFSVLLSQPGQTLTENVLYFDASVNLQLPDANIKVDVNVVPRSYNLVFKSNVLVKSVVLHTQNLKSEFSDNNFDLIPNKRTKISVVYSGTRQELIKDLVIKTLNKSEILYK